MNYSSRFFSTSIFVFVLAFFTAKPALAMEFRSSEQAVVVSENEMIAGTLFAAGNTVEINGAVEGDLVCVGQSVTVKGPVGGDILCAGQTIRILGDVGGNIRTASQTLEIDGVVARNVTIVGQTVTFGNESVVEGDVIAAGQAITLRGEIGKSMMGAGSTFTLDGTVGEDAHLAGNVIELGSAAVIEGKLTYESDTEAKIGEGAIVGEIVKQPMRQEFRDMGKSKKSVSKPAGFAGGKPWPLSAIPSLLTHLIIGALLVLLLKNSLMNVLGQMKAHAGASFIAGFLWMFVFPVLFLVLCMTVIGIPIALLYAGTFAVLMFVGKLFVAILIGNELLASYVKKQKENLYLATFIGVTITWLVFYLPYVGWLTSLLATVWGTGGLVRTVFLRRKK